MIKIMFFLFLFYTLCLVIPLAVITAEAQQNKARRVLWWVLSVAIAAAALLAFCAFADNLIKDF